MSRPPVLLITGASGFIGRNVLDVWPFDSFEVHAVSRRSLASISNVKTHACDLLDFPSISTLIDDVRPSHLLHLAWGMDGGAVYAAPSNLDWLAASCHLVRCFASAGGQRVVVSGSCAEYALSDKPCDETTTALQPTSLYGAAKHALHIALAKFAETAGIGYAWARIFFLTGPYESEKRLVPELIKALLNGQPAHCRAPDLIRDYLDVRDAASLLAHLLASDIQGPINLASGSGVRIADIALKLGDLTGRPDLVVMSEKTDGGPIGATTIVASTELLKRKLSVAPRFSLEESLRDAVARYLP